jgi:hypothetical protein
MPSAACVSALVVASLAGPLRAWSEASDCSRAAGGNNTEGSGSDSTATLRSSFALKGDEEIFGDCSILRAVESTGSERGGEDCSGALAGMT